jgi:peroxiredoxin
MSRESRMMALGTQAPDFSLPDAAGRLHTLQECAGGKALLVAFICNHCPYVQHMIGSFAALAREYQPRGLRVVAISSNDAAAYPEDAPPLMTELARRHDFVFPYLYDESQQVALAYEARCTPDLFLFDARLRLAYAGQFDDSRPGSRRPVTGADLRAALEAVLAGQPVAGRAKPSLGCGIKWKTENRPQWA